MVWGTWRGQTYTRGKSVHPDVVIMDSLDSVSTRTIDRWRSAGWPARARATPRLAVVDVELGRLVRRGPLVEVLQLGADRRRATCTPEPVVEDLAGDALVGEATDDMDCGLGRALRRQARRLLPELDLGLADVA